MRPSFADALTTCLNGIPRGRVATCGGVARALGDLRAAAAVARFLLDHPDTEAGHRVVRADGRPLLRQSTDRLEAECGLDAGGRVAPTSILEDVPEVPLLRELREEQLRLAARVSDSDAFGSVDRIGGADVSYLGDQAFAVAVTVEAQSLEPREIVVRRTVVDFPYIPTYLAFREFSAVQRAIQDLKQKPDVLFVDGHGRLHPIRFGFACFAGVSLDIPTVGIAKHLLVGHPDSPNPETPDVSPIRLDGSIQGFAWRPPGAGRPLYVSVGHRVSLKTALDLTRRATTHRYPEPLRIADRVSKEERKKNSERSASERAARRRPPAQSLRGI